MNKTIKAGVIGYPISHSLSPLIHNYWLDKHQINGSYELLEILPDNFEQDVIKLVKQGYSGFNVTVPYKERAYNLVDELSPTAQKIGAVNTIIVKEDNKLLGHNTDAFGFIENIKQSLNNFKFEGKKAMVLGAGGASKAIISGLLDENIQNICLTNRTFERAKKQEQSKVVAVDWNNKEEYLQDIDILINTTSQGMKGQSELIISLDNLPKESLVTDIVYNPLNTNLLINAQARENLTVTGIGMLLYQAAEGFESWFGKMPIVDNNLKELLLKK